MLSTEQFLAATAGYGQATKQSTAADRPPRYATIDPEYDPADYPQGVDPRVQFDGETTTTRKRWPVLGVYWPHPGDRVLMLPTSRDGYVVADATDSEDGPAVYTRGPVVSGNQATGSVLIEAPGDFVSVTAGRAGERTVEFGPLAGTGSTRVFTTADSATGLLMTTQAHTITSAGAVIRVVDTLDASSTTSRVVQWVAVRGFG